MDGSGGGWIIQVTYGAAMDWDEWTEQAWIPHLQAGLRRTSVTTTRTGTTASWRSGSHDWNGHLRMVTPFEVFHAPSNELFGFQSWTRRKRSEQPTTATVLGCTTPVRFNGTNDQRYRRHLR